MAQIFLVTLMILGGGMLQDAAGEKDKSDKTKSQDSGSETIKLPTIYQGEQGGLPKRGYRVISDVKDYEAFSTLMTSKGAKLPDAKEIDFDKHRVIVADYGRAENCSGIFPKELFRTKDGKLHIRYECRKFQTLRIGDAPLPTYHPWSVIVAPLEKSGYVIETDHHRIKGEPELWKADLELKP